jgi:hypothetical protein
MSTGVASALGRCSSSLGLRNKTTEAKAAPSGLTPIEYERIIGVGMARDWVGWARNLQSIRFAPQIRGGDVYRLGREQIWATSRLSESPSTALSR